MPKMLRLFFRFKRKLLDSLSLSAVRSLVKFLHTATGFELMPGVVAVIQTFGDRINFHPHIHVLITEGGTSPDGAFHHDINGRRIEILQNGEWCLVITCCYTIRYTRKLQWTVCIPFR
jgi:hypothetical protein